MTPMHNLTRLALAVALVAGGVGAAQAQSNLVANGGFETGSFSGWQTSNLSFLSGVDDLAAHSGDFGAFGGEGTLTQTLQTAAGTLYDLRFWLRNDGLTPNEFTVQWNGTTVFTAADLGAFDYREFAITGLGGGAASQLSIHFRNDQGFLEFDDISVTAVPEPSQLALMALGLAGMLAWRRSRTREDAAR